MDPPNPAPPIKKTKPRRTSLAAARIQSTDLDLKKTGLNAAKRSQLRNSPLLGVNAGAAVERTPSHTEQRQAEVLKRLQEMEETRRQKMLQKMRQGEERRLQVEKRRDQLRAMAQERGKQTDQKLKTRRLNAIQTQQSKYDTMVDKMNQRESRRQQLLGEAQAEKATQDSKALESVLEEVKKNQKVSRDRERAMAEAKRKRSKDAELRQRATQALWDRQQKIMASIRERNRAELERLLAVPQPQLTARMPKYNFMEYPANRNMRRLLFEYQHKRIDEVTFNKKAESLARKMSPRRILLHQNQLLREQLAMERDQAAGGSHASLVQISKDPIRARTTVNYKNPKILRQQAQKLAEALVDDALERSGSLYDNLLQRSDVDLTALIEEPVDQSFDDAGDIDESLSAFDFGDELEVDQEAVDRIEDMYKQQTCRVTSDRKLRQYPSTEIGTFSSAVLDVGVSCSCTTLSGIDSQCSLCQQQVAEKNAKQRKGKKFGVLSGLRKLF